jgi:hypothetical protein
VTRFLRTTAWKTEYRSQCPSLPYPITLFNADSASAEYSATTIGPQPDESRFFFWTIRPVRVRSHHYHRVRRKCARFSTPATPAISALNRAHPCIENPLLPAITLLFPRVGLPGFTVGARPPENRGIHADKKRKRHSPK